LLDCTASYLVSWDMYETHCKESLLHTPMLEYKNQKSQNKSTSWHRIYGKGKMPNVSVVTPLWICGALKTTIQILSGDEVEEADLGCTRTRARIPSVGKCWGHSDCPAVVLIAGGEWPVRLCEWAVQLWAGCVRAALAHERRCGPMEREGSVAHERRCGPMEREGSVAHERRCGLMERKGSVSPWEALWADGARGQRSPSECCDPTCWLGEPL
jgi:hypothetical protein